MCRVLVACAVLPGAAHAGQPVPEGPPSAGGQTVVVLPFVNTSRAQPDQWIGRGIAATLASDLPRRAGVTVTVRGVPGRGVDDGALFQALGEHGAAWLVAGSYQRVGARLRIIARLLDVETGVAVHTIRVDGSVEELFRLQDRVVAELSAAIRTRQPPSGLVARAESAPVAR